MPKQKIVVLTQGQSNPVTAKTGASVIRYRADEVVALLDDEHAGKTAADLLGIGASIPVIASLDEAPHADTLLIGTAPTGGRMPESWREILKVALARGMQVVSGLHDFLGDDPELVAVAKKSGATIYDVRRNNENDVAVGTPLGDEYTRILTVGNDCSIGKMVASIELDRALRAKGHTSTFVATGQTGIMIAGEGVPIDRVIADFVNGAAERLVQSKSDNDFVIIEGQGSLAHPLYSAVTLGLMHGSQPQGLILCYEAGRETASDKGLIPLRPLSQLVPAYEAVGNLVAPTKVIAVVLNGRRLTVEEAEVEKSRVRDELGLPVCDVFRDGCDELVAAAEKLRGELAS